MNWTAQEEIEWLYQERARFGAVAKQSVAVLKGIQFMLNQRQQNPDKPMIMENEIPGTLDLVIDNLKHDADEADAAAADAKELRGFP